MSNSRLSSAELHRVRALHDLGILDTAHEDQFDALAKAAALLCDTPIALISLIDSDRQWFKANVGLTGVLETPREPAFCAHAIEGTALFEVPDATADPRFAANPLVTAEPEIRFYAGMPLSLGDGSRVGMLCVIDRKPRTLTTLQCEVLGHLGAVAARAMEGRRALQSERELLGRVADSEEHLNRMSHILPAMSYSVDMAGKLIGVSSEWLRVFGYAEDEVLGQQLSRFLQPKPPPIATTRF